MLGRIRSDRTRREGRVSRMTRIEQQRIGKGVMTGERLDTFVTATTTGTTWRV